MLERLAEIGRDIANAGAYGGRAARDGEGPPREVGPAVMLEVGMLEVGPAQPGTPGSPWPEIALRGGSLRGRS